MNKRDAIEVLKKKMINWPQSVRSQSAPDGWAWKVRNLPYRPPEYILWSELGIIVKSDVFS